MLEYSLTPIQQFSYRTGKNSTDSAMIIDAMDILYTKDIDSFCLATSDCDFTKIASRLRESGKTVIGMGESKTHKSFISACNEFKYIDVLTENADAAAADDNAQTVVKTSITPLNEIRNAIFDIINAADGKVQFGGLKSSIKSKFPDFDERNYGYSKFSTFISSFSEIHIEGNGIQNFAIIKCAANNDVKQISEYVVKHINSTKKKYYTSAEIQNLIVKEFKEFKLKNLGYSNMKAFLKSINTLKMGADGKYTCSDN